MTVAPQGAADASSDSVTRWRSIQWSELKGEVRRLQTRIAKAVSNKCWRKAKALQWLLTHSFAAKALAVKRVTENAGARTPGVDKKIWRTDKQKMQAVDALRRSGYQPMPLRRTHIPKKNGRMRPLSIPTMHDRAMQALHALALAPIAETTGDRNSYGFREGRSCADAIGQCLIALAKGCSAQWVLEADIKSCFDEISHRWLLDHIPMDKQLLRLWLKAGFIEKEALHPTEAGTPQGGIISPLLAKMTLDGLEQAILDAVPARGSKVNVIRYADDFIVTAKDKETLEAIIQPVIENHLTPRGLKLSTEKTVVTHIQHGLVFLGQTLRKVAHAKLLITPAKASVKALLGKVRVMLRTHRASTAQSLIAALNPIIRGWANYHRHIAAKDTFAKVDHAIHAALVRWARRRHPTKCLGWLVKKYFPTGHGHFSAPVTAARGKQRLLQLYRAVTTKIQRHIKVRAQANPYDPRYTDYFERRRVFAWRVMNSKSTGQPVAA